MYFVIYEPEIGDLVSFTLLKTDKQAETPVTRILLVLDPTTDQVLDETGTPITVNLRFTSTNPWIKNVSVVRAGATIMDYVHSGLPSKGLIQRERRE